MVKVPGYNIKRQIGSGGMASVYLAVQESLDREVALKVMSPALMADSVFAKRFQREAKTVAKLSHPHIVPIYDVGVTTNQLHYFSMAYLSNGDLSDRFRAGLNEAELIRIMIGIVDALGYAHQLGYIHRDVKPGNVLFDSSNNPVLSDFGIARAASQATKMTGTGVSVGTSHYMSPEQARGRAVDGRADLYSLGVVAFEALTGHPPFEGEDGFAVAYSHVFDPIPRLPPALEHWQRFIDRALAKSAEDRFGDSEDMKAWLTQLHPQGRGQMTAPSDTDRVSPTTPLPTVLSSANRPAVLGQKPSLKSNLKKLTDKGFFFLPERVRALAALVSAFLVVSLAAILAFSGSEPEADISPEGVAANVPQSSSPLISNPTAVESSGVDAESSENALEDSIPSDDDIVSVASFEAEDLSAIQVEAPPADAQEGSTEDPTAPQILSRVEFLIGRAEEALEKDQLTTPADDNAYDLYREALVLMPEDPRLLEGIERIIQRYLALSERKVQEADFSTALTYVERGESVGRDLSLSDELSAALGNQRDVILSSAQQSAVEAKSNGDNDTALRLLELAQRLDPGNDDIRQQIDELNDPTEMSRFRDTLQSGGNGPEMMVVELTPFSVPVTDGELAISESKKIAVSLYEVTVAEYQLFAERSSYFNGRRAAACRNQESFWGASRNRTWDSPGFDQASNHPVICVAWEDAAAYANWISAETGLSYRLPSEAEWDYLAAMSVQQDVEEICQLGNVADRWLQRTLPKAVVDNCEDGWIYTAPVGRYMPSEQGFYDIIGNAREWVSDCWQAERPTGEKDFSAVLDGKCGKRVVKGSAWAHPGSEAVDLAARRGFDADKSYNTVGFRLVRNLEPDEQ